MMLIDVFSAGIGGWVWLFFCLRLRLGVVETRVGSNTRDSCLIGGW